MVFSEITPRTKIVITVTNGSDMQARFMSKVMKNLGVKDVDVYMPAATQNDVCIKCAEKIVESGVKYYIEVANMPTTNEALELLRKSNIIVAPSKAVNAGGVGVSALEMSQNSERLVWSANAGYSRKCNS